MKKPKDCLEFLDEVVKHLKEKNKNLKEIKTFWGKREKMYKVNIYKIQNRPVSSYKDSFSKKCFYVSISDIYEIEEITIAAREDAFNYHLKIKTIKLKDEDDKIDKLLVRKFFSEGYECWKIIKSDTLQLESPAQIATEIYNGAIYWKKLKEKGTEFRKELTKENENQIQTFVDKL